MEREQDKVGHNGVGRGKPWGHILHGFFIAW